MISQESNFFESKRNDIEKLGLRQKINKSAKNPEIFYILETYQGILPQ
jgi:hypothetical protein